MKILFILPKINSPTKWIVGLAYMSAILKKAGYQVELLEVNKKEEIKKVVPLVKLCQPAIIGLSANSHQYTYAKEIAKQIKLNFNIPVFLGGVHAALTPDQIIKDEIFDGVCVGEGEKPFLDLVKRIEEGEDYSDVSNFWFYSSGGFVKNDVGPLVSDLDDLPLPDISIFKFYNQAGQSEIVPRFIFSRGCPFNCTYCCNHVFKKIYAGHGRYLRFRSVDKALDEISSVREKYNFSHFKIDDDTFSLNKDWLIEFCNKYKKKFDMSFECNIRPGSVDEEILLALKEAGCSLIKIGLETGNEALRKEILGRSITNQNIVGLFQSAKKVGLDTFSFNMIGVPGETKETIKETINLNAQVKPTFMQVTAFYPYLGTLLGQKCIDEGLIGSYRVDSYMEESILSLPNLSAKDIKRAVKNFQFNVYKSYSIGRALLEKKRHLKGFITSKPFLVKIIKPVYKLIKFS